MFKVDTSDFKRLERDLKTMAQKAVPFAQRSVVNGAAFEGRKIWQEELQDDLILRNRFTTTSIRVLPARSLNPRRMEATLGSDAPYMRRLELGGHVQGPIPTEFSAGHSIGTQPRKRLVRPSNKMQAIRLTDRDKRGTRRQRNLVAIRRALESGNRYVFLETQRGPGIFKVTGSARALQVKMVWDLGQGTHLVPPHPLLEQTLAKLERRMDRIAREAMLEQLRRHKVFGY